MRPYRNRKIGELELLFDQHRDDANECEFLAREVALRKQTARVENLRQRIVQRISVGFRDRDGAGQSETIFAPAPVDPQGWIETFRNWFRRLFGRWMR